MDGRETQDGGLVVLRRLHSDEDAPGLAREAVQELLVDMEPHSADKAEDLVLSVSELVSNAVVHGPPGDVALRVEAIRTFVRIEVSDKGSAAFHPSARTGTGGHWGLGLVRKLCDRSGIERRPWTVAWCEIDLAD